METLLSNVKTEAHFLFVCKLIGPFLSKIHIENTSLLIDVKAKKHKTFTFIYLFIKTYLF